MTRGYLEYQIPKSQHSERFGSEHKSLVTSKFPCISSPMPHVKQCHFITDQDAGGLCKGSVTRSKNKFILMRSLLHSMVLKIANCAKSDQLAQSNVEEVSKIASWLWKRNQGPFQSYHALLAVFEEHKTFDKPTTQLTKQSLIDKIGKQCIPSTYSYETLTNGAHSTAMESKKTYKAFCGRFSLKEATGRVRKKKPIQTFALRSNNIEDIFSWEDSTLLL
ncbi:LADA_0H03158g1_1 [Lachancea dasiensis]|uniref:LADA_0H00144g1_1 n=1 Tax=Lachancea dasiensis TaxID=1072105 RepID=A0A1G4JYN5_9SACH|nr:LADA_0H00144g1_1 [Lachancea dasiensis]SCU96865.1 LADA_0H03158g1_1 [Lachancea dasiensis]